MPKTFSLIIPDWAELSHCYNMGTFFHGLNRGYEVCLRMEVTLADGSKKLLQGKSSNNDPQVACDDARLELIKKNETAQLDHDKHMEIVSKLKSSRPPEPPKPSMATLTLDDLDL